MGNPITGHHPICNEIASALGLKRCTSLKIEMATSEIVTITASYYAEENGMAKLPEILKKYELIERND